MTVERMHPPQYWRMRAEEFRAKADNCQHSETRKSLPRAADSYDQLARSAEQFRTVRDYADDQRAHLGERDLERPAIGMGSCVASTMTRHAARIGAARREQSSMCWTPERARATARRGSAGWRRRAFF